jgi:hypothetical protein
MTATNANVSGTITTSNLTATGGTISGGTIGGWNIRSNSITGGNSARGYSVLEAPNFSSYSWTFAINSPSSANLSSAKFRIDDTGVVVARNIYVTEETGTIYATTNNTLRLSNDGLQLRDSSGNYAYITLSTGAYFKGNLIVAGTKSRIADTEDYGKRLLYCYETPTPMFGDLGEGKIAEDGKCYVWLDSTFSETIKTQNYQVFLQKYGQGECYVTERTERYFVVEGTPDMKFGWEIKARQSGFENMRLDSYYEQDQNKQEEPMDYAQEAIRHLEIIKDEREVA